ncbi:hypothetical protein PTTG_25985 [Puccinia triticina 1-1 BBBD Race 1]|uniref:Uncharacterized protein n=1 Tax=Puccinia triticina (isolate 1-1 / race 1 (BBBD)) TaxID=630390 RepID=A0A180GYF3_PUCT1|nr:hypothetical protein PTTG_25985 [Puccinia triticina 1-1 BBBD Race 1]
MDHRLPVAPNLQQVSNSEQAFPSQRPDNWITAKDARQQKEMVNFEEAEFLLQQSKLVAGQDNWYRNLLEVGRAFLTSATFFFKECSNSTFEKIGRAVLISSIDQSLVAEMQEFVTCYEMYIALLNKFKTASRAAQMNIWYKFKNFKIDPEGHNAGSCCL